MIDNRSNIVLKKILEKIELPEGAYKKAEQRYRDIHDWLCREESECVDNDPHVFSQGSFRLGTAIKPADGEEYDLDMSCCLRSGLAKSGITQKQLKDKVGRELEAYRKARNIKEELDEKNRCWRLEYADDLSFHLDVVPSIPENDVRRNRLQMLMVENTRLDEDLARRVAELAVSITDRTDETYQLISDDWRISNPEGYAKWFESKMRTAKVFISEREASFRASIDKFPYYQWKTPLQQSIQLLKRHRDTVFSTDDEAKPISVIITTLAARAYSGESDLVTSISNILKFMDQHINQTVPLVPNPVNPDEDFADKWYAPEHAHLKLRDNFNRWLIQARADFVALCSQNDSQRIVEAADRGLGLSIDRSDVELALGLSATPISSTVNAIENSDPRPWYER